MARPCCSNISTACACVADGANITGDGTSLNPFAVNLEEAFGLAPDPDCPQLPNALQLVDGGLYSPLFCPQNMIAEQATPDVVVSNGPLALTSVNPTNVLSDNRLDSCPAFEPTANGIEIKIPGVYTLNWSSEATVPVNGGATGLTVFVSFPTVNGANYYNGLSAGQTMGLSPNCGCTLTDGSTRSVGNVGSGTTCFVAGDLINVAVVAESNIAEPVLASRTRMGITYQGPKC